MQTIGFIGTGIMGQGMIRNLMKAGYPVQIYNRTRSKAEALEREGAVWKDSAAQCAAGCGVVITIVGYPQDVEEVYFGPGGLLESAQPGTVLIDMTTTSPKLAQRIYDQARERGLDALDAPVSAYLAEQAETLAALDLHQALTISSVSAWCVWLLFLLLAVRGMKKSSGKSHAHGV